MNTTDVKETAEAEEYEEISLLELMSVFFKQKKLIAGTTVLATVVGLVYVLFFVPGLYLSHLQAMLVAPYVIDKENVSLRMDNSMVLAIVHSESMKAALDKQFHLMERLQKKYPRSKKRDLDKLMGKNIGVGIAEDQTINVYAKAKSPKLAQDIATFIFKKTDEMLKEMGIVAVNTVNEANDVMLEKEIKDKIAEINAKDQRRDSSKITELLGMYSAIMARDEGYRLRGKQPLGLQLLSPASYPDSIEPRHRAKTVVLFTMLGFFLGLVLAFMKYVWSTVDEGKKQELKAALKVK